MAPPDEPVPRDIVTSRAFERDLKRLRKRGFDLEPLWDLVEVLRLERPIDARHRDHALAGDWKGFRDCHIRADWVLIYTLDGEAVYLRAPNASRSVAPPPPGAIGDEGPTVDQPKHNDSSLIDTIIADRYKIRQEIGEGGMGTVYLAEQLRPVRRQVALKLIKPGMDSRNVLSGRTGT
jgi:mRNA interferase YafQ